MNRTSKPLDWTNILFLTSTPVAAVVGTSLYTYYNGLSLPDLLCFFGFFIPIGIAVTAGYHRYYAHRSHECHPVIQWFYLLFGAAAVENSVLRWASDHRYHHKYVDQEEDPYNVLKGGLHAHILWIFHKDTRGPARFNNVPDFLADPRVMWQERNYLALVGLFTFVLPALAGFAYGRPLAGFLWGGLLRLVVLHHMTFFVNSWAHMFGTRPYTEDNTARDCWWVAYVTNGEGYHNFHHRFPSDYRNGLRWYQWDPTKWWTWCLEKFRLTYRLNRTPDPVILQARLAVEVTHLERRLTGAPEKLWARLRVRAAAGRSRLELAMSRYAEAKVHYRRMAEEASREARLQWKAKVAEYRRELAEASVRWKEFKQALRRLPAYNA